MMVGSSLYLRPLMVFTRLVMICSQLWYLPVTRHGHRVPDRYNQWLCAGATASSSYEPMLIHSVLWNSHARNAVERFMEGALLGNEGVRPTNP